MSLQLAVTETTPLTSTIKPLVNLCTIADHEFDRGRNAFGPCSDLRLFLVTDSMAQCRGTIGNHSLSGSAQPGSFLVIPANTAAEIDCDHTLIGLMCRINSQLTEDILADHSIGPNRDGWTWPGIFRDSLAERLIVSIADGHGKPTSIFSMLQQRSISLLVVAIFSHGMTNKTPSDKRNLDRVLDHIEKNLSDPIRIHELAAVAQLSRWHFTRWFKGVVGTSPHRFVVERRLQRVKEMLRNTELTLAEIAYSCGFCSQSHMTDAFTRFVGLPPGRYRRTSDF